MGVNPTPWGYSPYDEIIHKLVAHGIPREQIAAIGDAESDAKKQALFEKVRHGSVRVLIGSTQKMGTGTNVQKRLVALHHLDAPWKPAEVEQRDGRILRQGTKTRRWRSTATSPKDPSTLICGKPWKPRPGLSRRSSPATTPPAVPRTSAARNSPTPRSRRLRRATRRC